MSIVLLTLIPFRTALPILLHVRGNAIQSLLSRLRYGFRDIIGLAFGRGQTEEPLTRLHTYSFWEDAASWVELHINIVLESLDDVSLG